MIQILEGLLIIIDETSSPGFYYFEDFISNQYRWTKKGQQAILESFPPGQSVIYHEGSYWMILE